MFWIHGGTFKSGTNNDPTFDGATLVSRGDVVMVAINYRLTTLGFLALDETVTKGNHGFADQINALKWVQRNIQDFSGGPNRITIFGQSAGAASARGMLASPKTNSMFVGVISQSDLGGNGYRTTYSQYFTAQQGMAAAGTAILEATNCSTAFSKVECLRTVLAYTLANLESARYLVVDGNYLTSSGLVLNNTGSLRDVHILSNFVNDDVPASITLVETENLTMSLIHNGFNAPAIENFGLSPLPNSPNVPMDVFNLSARVATDTVFRCIDQATTYASLVSKTFAPNQSIHV